jgi:hypothetical protein
MTAMATRITTRFPRSSNPCAAATRRRALLAGEDDPRRRRPALHRAADCDLRGGRRGPGRSDGAGAGERRAGRPPNLLAGPRRGFPWPRPRSTSPPRTRATAPSQPLTPRSPTCAPAARLPCRNICAIPITGREKTRPRHRLRICARGQGPFRGAGLSGVDKTFYEPTEQGVEKKIKERVEKWRAGVCGKKWPLIWTATGWVAAKVFMIGCWKTQTG